MPRRRLLGWGVSSSLAAAEGVQWGGVEMGREEYRRGSTTRGRRRSSAVSRPSPRAVSQPHPRRRLRVGRVSLRVCSRRRACRPPWATAPQRGLCALRPRQCVLASTAPPSEGAPAREGALLGQMPNGGYFHVPLTPHPRIPGWRRAGAASAEGSSISPVQGPSRNDCLPVLVKFTVGTWGQGNLVMKIRARCCYNTGLESRGRS